jgi:hypothetical protein
LEAVAVLFGAIDLANVAGGSGACGVAKLGGCLRSIVDELVDPTVGRAVVLDGRGFIDVGAVGFGFGEVNVFAASLLAAVDVDGARDCRFTAVDETGALVAVAEETREADDAETEGLGPVAPAGFFAATFVELPLVRVGADGALTLDGVLPAAGRLAVDSLALGESFCGTVFDGKVGLFAELSLILTGVDDSWISGFDGLSGGLLFTAEGLDSAL